MLQLVDTAHLEESPILADVQEIQNFILIKLATDFSDDHDFLRKVNKMTFGLISKQ